MHEDRVESEQFINCSDELTEAVNPFAPQKKSRPAHPGSLHRTAHPSRLPDRAFPPLWKTGVQVCRRTGAWSQVLPLRQLSHSETTAAVRSRAVPRTGHAIPGELSEAEESPRGRLRHQSRTAAKESGPVGHGWPARQGNLHRCRGHRSSTRPDAALSSGRGERSRDRSRGGRR